MFKSIQNRPSGSTYTVRIDNPNLNFSQNLLGPYPDPYFYPHPYPYNLNNQSLSTMPLQVAWVGAVVADYLCSCLTSEFRFSV